MDNRFQNIHRTLYDSGEANVGEYFNDSLNKYVNDAMLEKIGIYDFVNSLEEQVNALPYYDKNNEEDKRYIDRQLREDMADEFLSNNYRPVINYKQLLQDKEGYKKNKNYDYMSVMNTILDSLKNVEEGSGDGRFLYTKEKDVPIKKTYDDLYKTVGGLEGLFAKRKEAGLKVDYDEDEINTMLRDLSSSEIVSVPLVNINNLLKGNPDATVSFSMNKRPVIAEADGIYSAQDNVMDIYPYDTPASLYETYMHELQHAVQNLGSDTQQRIIPQDYLPNGESNLQATEAQAAIADHLASWQAVNDRIMVSPKDMEDFIADMEERGGIYYGDKLVPANIVRIMLPKLAYHKTNKGNGYA